MTLFADHHDGSPRLVRRLDPATAAETVTAHHYLHRAPPITWAFGLFDGGNLKGVMTLGVPASRELMKSACPTDPEAVLELNRLWVADEMPRNTETWFLARALALCPPLIVVSFADAAFGHMGYVYRAANFRYAGWTDMDRKTARLDYVVAGKHSRDAFRSGEFTRQRRTTKVKYWTVTGQDRRARRAMAAACAWPSMSWKDEPPPLTHERRATA